jgi:hypothetical protein
MSSHEADQRLALASRPIPTARRDWRAHCDGGDGHRGRVRCAATATERSHVVHTLLAMLAYACIYLAIGTAVGSIIRDALAGSLTVVFIFLLDVFSGPGMSRGSSGLATLLSPSQKAGELLLAAGAGMNSPGEDWTGAGASVGVAVAIALSVFWLAARRRR